MMTPISRQTASSSYALRTLTNIASWLKTRNPEVQQSFGAPTVGMGREQNEAKSRIVSGLLQSPALQAPSDLTQIALTVPTTHGLKQRLGGYWSVNSYVAMMTDRNGNAVISSTDPQGTATVSNGALDTSAADEPLFAFANNKSSTHAIVSDLDVDIVEGSDAGEFLAIASKRSVDRVYGGGGNDRMVVFGGPASGGYAPSVSRVYGGEGDDDIIVRGERVDIISGDEGNDRIFVVETGIASRIKSGEGNDTINLVNTDKVFSVDSGAGDDTIHADFNNFVSGLSTGDGDDDINIHQTRTVRKVDAGDGDDTISISAEHIQEISGGRGDDQFLIRNLGGNVSSFFFSEGDGQDTIKADGPVKLQRFSEDGTQTLDLSKAIVTYENSDKVKISFEDSADSITVDLGLGRSRIAVEATDDGGLLITRPDYAEAPAQRQSRTVGVSSTGGYIFG